MTTLPLGATAKKFHANGRAYGTIGLILPVRGSYERSRTARRGASVPQHFSE
jgi:hypothetical protein